MSVLGRFILITLPFCLSACSEFQKTKILGKYHLERTDTGFSIGLVDDKPCNRIFIDGDISSAKLAPIVGVSFIDNNGVPSFVEPYPQPKRCAEYEIFSDVLTKNNINYLFDSFGNTKVIDPNKLSNPVKEKLSTEVSSAYSSIVLGYENYPVKYSLDASGRFSESTDANYFHQNPSSNFQGDLGFDFYAATTFGLRAYKFNSSGAVEAEHGDFNTTFYGIAEIDDNVFVSTGFKSIFILDKKNLEKKDSIDGMYVSSLYPYKTGLLVVAYKNSDDWQKGRLYYLDINKKTFSMLSDANIADSRGIAVDGGKIYVTSGYDKKIIVFNENDFSFSNWYGFNYPNGLTAANGILLVGDEHSGVIRKINLNSKEIVLSFGFGLIASPSSAVILEKGQFKGSWLVADTDKNRIIIANPYSNQILYEVNNIRSTMALWVEK